MVLSTQFRNTNLFAHCRSHRFGAHCLFVQRASRVADKTDSVTSKASEGMSHANVAFDLLKLTSVR